MKLSNEEIAKVFAMYIGCDFVFSQSSKSLTSTGVTPNWVYDLHQDKYVIGACKLLLTPLSEITDEHAVEVARIYGANIEDIDKDEPITRDTEFGWLTVNIWEIVNTEYNEGDICPLIITAKGECHDSRGFSSNQHLISQYLISCGYAVPLFFAPNHLANGKTPLDLGIAISKNEVK